MPLLKADGADRQTAHSQIYAELREMMMSGAFQPGERLVVRDLTERFQTSTMPIREALRQLVSEGIFSDEAHRGVEVPLLTQESVSDIVRVRCSVEGTAAEWAAASMTGTEIAAITSLNDRMQAAISEDIWEEYLALNRAFHFAIYRAARSPALLQIIERLWLKAGPWLNFMREPATIRFGHEHHAEILLALRTGDGARSRQAVASDIAGAGAVIARRMAAAAPPTLHPIGRKAAR